MAGPPTPEPTPGVDPARVAADQAKKEIERILQCPESSYAQILAVGRKSSEDEKTEAWTRLGCMIHPKYYGQDSEDERKKAEEAFMRLEKAATELGVDQPFIGAVNNWDGKEDLLAEEEGASDDGTGNNTMEEDPVPKPPAPVMALYHKATPLLYQLGSEPGNAEVERQIVLINEEIEKENLSESESNPRDQWKVQFSFFRTHYKIAMEEYTKLRSNPVDKVTRDNISEEKNLIDKHILKHHFPAEWTIMTADEHLAGRDEHLAGADEHLAGDAKRKVNIIEYPWTTMELTDGSHIVGVRQQGRWGTQVCVEEIEDGRVVRRLESASEVGLLEVERYKKMDGHKNLAQGQSEWSNKNRDDFEELLWVAKSQIQKKNLAAGRKDPPTDCCVKFHTKGIQILTVASLSRVLGPTSARAQIEKICKRDQIPPPWKAGWVSSYNDPASVEKDVKKRRAKKDAQARASLSEYPTPKRRSQSMSSSGSIDDTINEARDKKIEVMETAVADLTKTVNTLAAMFQEFMKTTAK